MASLHFAEKQNGTVSALQTGPLFNAFNRKRYLPIAQETKRRRKADKGNLERHILPHLSSYRLNGIATEVLLDWTNTLKLIHSLPRRADVPWLFFTRNGTRLAAITREWYEIRELFGRPELRLQDLRHSFANFLVSIGINQRDLRGILGHYKPETLALVRNNSFENNVRA